jgi:hypothetical protein
MQQLASHIARRPAFAVRIVSQGDGMPITPGRLFRAISQLAGAEDCLSFFRYIHDLYSGSMSQPSSADSAMHQIYRTFLACSIIFLSLTPAHASEYQDLLDLFSQWRSFETPPQRDGAPDYTAATFKARHKTFAELQQRLDAMDTSGWSVPQQVDWQLVNPCRVVES